jgi:hypothetical protein
MPRSILLACLLTAFTAGTALADNWSKAYDVGAAAALRVSVGDAVVHVGAWSEPRIRIDVEAEGWKIGPGGLRLTESQLGDRVTFELREPPIQLHFGLSRRSVRIEIHAPAKTALELNSGDGSVTCEGLTGGASIRTGDGSITADGLAGDVTLHAGDGSVEAWNLDGRLVASTGDGSVRLNGRFAGLDVTTSDGSVTLEVVPGSRLSATWSVRTGDGPVVLRLPTDLKATLDAHSGDGKMTVDLPVTLQGAVRENELHAALNGGGPELRVRTGDGSIVIEPYVEGRARPAAQGEHDDHGPIRKVHSIKHGR